MGRGDGRPKPEHSLRLPRLPICSIPEESAVLGGLTELFDGVGQLGVRDHALATRAGRHSAVEPRLDVRLAAPTAGSGRSPRPRTRLSSGDGPSPCRSRTSCRGSDDRRRDLAVALVDELLDRRQRQRGDLDLAVRELLELERSRSCRSGRPSRRAAPRSCPRSRATSGNTRSRAHTSRATSRSASASTWIVGRVEQRHAGLLAQRADQRDLVDAELADQHDDERLLALLGHACRPCAGVGLRRRGRPRSRSRRGSSAFPRCARQDSNL